VPRLQRGTRPDSRRPALGAPVLSLSSQPPASLAGVSARDCRRLMYVRAVRCAPSRRPCHRPFACVMTHPRYENGRQINVMNQLNNGLWGESLAGSLLTGTA
jgi:hypothetical protein